MESMNSFWQLSDHLRGQPKVSEDHKWSMAASKLAEQTRSKGERRNNLDLSKGPTETRPRDNVAFQEDNRFETFNFNMLNLDPKITEDMNKTSFRSSMYNSNGVYQKSNGNNVGNLTGSKYGFNNNKEPNSYNIINNNNDNNVVSADKRFKTLPAAETLPRNEVLGGYIFVCNNDTMQEDLKRQLFGNHILNPLYPSFGNILEMEFLIFNRIGSERIKH